MRDMSNVMLQFDAGFPPNQRVKSKNGKNIFRREGWKGLDTAMKKKSWERKNRITRRYGNDMYFPVSNCQDK
jgi:hypothetical protein